MGRSRVRRSVGMAAERTALCQPITCCCHFSIRNWELKAISLPFLFKVELDVNGTPLTVIPGLGPWIKLDRTRNLFLNMEMNSFKLGMEVLVLCLAKPKPQIQHFEAHWMLYKCRIQISVLVLLRVCWRCQMN